MNKRKAEDTKSDENEGELFSFDYASTVEGALFDSLPLSSEILEQVNDTSDEKTGESICDAAESVLDMANQLGFTVSDVAAHIGELGTVYKYINQLENGGFSQWAYNTSPSTDVEMTDVLEAGLKNINAKQSLKVFKEAMVVLRGLSEADITLFEDSDYFDQGPNTAIRDKLDVFNDRLWGLAVKPENSEASQNTDECLRVQLNKYAIDIAKKEEIITEVTDEEIASNDPLTFLTPSWWPACIPEADVTTMADSKKLLTGLRRAAALNGFGFVRFGYAPDTDGKTSKTSKTSKKDKKDKNPPLPKVAEAKEIFQTEEPDDDAPPTPTASTAPFWMISTIGSLVCQIFDAPSSEDDDKPTLGNCDNKPEVAQMAVFFDPEGSPCGMGPLDEIDDEEGEEDVQNLYDILEGEEEEDDEAPDLVPV